MDGAYTGAHTLATVNFHRRPRKAESAMNYRVILQVLTIVIVAAPMLGRRA